MIGYIAIQLLTLATALYRIYNIPLMITVIIIAIATTIYMHFGGQTSVIFTDLFQMFNPFICRLAIVFSRTSIFRLWPIFDGLGSFWSYP